MIVDLPEPFGPAKTRKRNDRAMLPYAAGSWIFLTRLVTLPVLSTFTNQPSFTTSNSSTSSNAERLAALVAAIDALRKVLLVNGAFVTFRVSRVDESFVAMW
jgi:hypothetical protein